jgi:hypothetical protein
VHIAIGVANLCALPSRISGAFHLHGDAQSRRDIASDFKEVHVQISETSTVGRRWMCETFQIRQTGEPGTRLSALINLVLPPTMGTAPESFSVTATHGVAAGINKWMPVQQVGTQLSISELVPFLQMS